MFVIFAFLTLFSTVHAETVRVPSETSVYKTPNSTSRVLFELKPGEVVEIEAFNDQFAKVRVRRGKPPKLVIGYVDRLELDVTSEPAASVDPNESQREWAIGFGPRYAMLSQGPMTFTTQDTVKRTTSGYKSSGPAFFASLQYHEQDFWRLEVAYLPTNFTSTATQNVQGAPTQDVSLKQTVLMGSLQKAWSFFGSKHYYFGPGLVLGKALSETLTLGGSPVTTTSSDLAFYAGGMVFVGAKFNVGQSFSIYVEPRVTALLNQSPMMLAYEGALGLLYWF